MTPLPYANDPIAEWRAARLLYSLYKALGQEFTIDLPACNELDACEEVPSQESRNAAAVWFEDVDQLIPVHHLRQFLQTSSLANEECVRTVLEHHLGKADHGNSDRDKIDFLLVQFFSVCAASPLEDDKLTLEYVAQILEPVLGKVEVSVCEWQQPLDELAQGANACRSLQELFTCGVLDKGRKLKISSGKDYFTPAALVTITRFNFLLRRVFFRLMHQDLNAILDGLRELEQRGVESLDCRPAEFSAEEPVSRLRMICQSWKVMFQAEYSSGQPLRLLVDLRAVIDAALEDSAQNPASQPPSSPAPLAKAAAASGGAATDDATATHEADPGQDDNA